jgi:hypothetical protein
MGKSEGGRWNAEGGKEKKLKAEKKLATDPHRPTRTGKD